MSQMDIPLCFQRVTHQQNTSPAHLVGHDALGRGGGGLPADLEALQEDLGAGLHTDTPNSTCAWHQSPSWAKPTVLLFCRTWLALKGAVSPMAVTWLGWKSLTHESAATHSGQIE